MKNLILPIFITICLLNSCGQKQAKTEKQTQTQQDVYYSSGLYYPKTDNVVNCTEDNLPQIEYCTLNKVKLPKEYDDCRCFMYNDSILLIFNNKNPSPYLLTILNYKTKNIIAQYFEYGTGRSKFKSMLGCLRKNYINLYDYEKRIVSRLCIDSVLTKGNEYVAKWTGYASLNLLDFVYHNDSVITWANPQYIKGFGLKGIPNFVQTNLRGKTLTNYPKNSRVESHFALHRTIANTDNYYMEFWENFPVINIYDKNFRLKKQYRDTKFKDTELELSDDMLFEKNVALECFDFGCQTNKYVLVNNFRSSETFEGYVLCIGDSAQGKFHEIWVFDVNCNLARRLKCRNLKGQVVGLSYCEESGNLYMNVIDDKYNNVFYQCIFEK